MSVKSLAPRQCGSDFKSIIFKLEFWNSHFQTQIFNCSSCRTEVALRWTPQNLSDQKSTQVQVMTWCRHATSHYLSWYWPKFLSPYHMAIASLQWVKSGIVLGFVATQMQWVSSIFFVFFLYVYLKMLMLILIFSIHICHEFFVCFQVQMPVICVRSRMITSRITWCRTTSGLTLVRAASPPTLRMTGWRSMLSTWSEAPPQIPLRRSYFIFSHAHMVSWRLQLFFLPSNL